jgi:hypothetical protein
MSKTRTDLDEEQTKASLLSLPLDVIQYPIPAMVHADKDYDSIETTRAMAALSGACKTIYRLFQPELDKRGAKQLLINILHGGNVAIVAAVKIAESNPRLFFIKATAMDHAMDLEGNRRTIEGWSPYQAIFGTHNKALLLAVQPSLDAYLETLSGGFDLAANQEQEKFPNGFDFPPCTDEFNQRVNELELAITNDQQLRQNWKNPNPATFILLEKLRSYYKPGIVQMGHHFNMNDVIKTHEIDYRNWSNNTWNGNQLAFFDVFVIGFQERLMTAPYLDAACTGLNNHINNGEPLKGNFEVINYATNENKKAVVVPLGAEDPSCRLGEAFLVDSYYGRGAWRRGAWPPGCVVPFARFLENYVKQTQQSFRDLCTHQRNKRLHHV